MQHSVTVIQLNKTFYYLTVNVDYILEWMEKDRKKKCRKWKHWMQKLYKHWKLEDLAMNVDRSRNRFRSHFHIHILMHIYHFRHFSFRNFSFLRFSIILKYRKWKYEIKINIRKISWSGIRLFLERIRSYTRPKRDQSGPR